MLVEVLVKTLKNAVVGFALLLLFGFALRVGLERDAAMPNHAPPAQEVEQMKKEQMTARFDAAVARGEKIPDINDDPAQ